MGLDWLAETVGNYCTATGTRFGVVSITTVILIFVLGLCLGLCAGCGWGLYLGSAGGPAKVAVRGIYRLEGHRLT